MQDTNKSRKNLEWLESQRLELQINLFKDYTEIMKIVTNNIMEMSITEKCVHVIAAYRKEKDATQDVAIIREV